MPNKFSNFTLILIILVSTALTFSSCGDDESDVVGSWNLVSLLSSGCDNPEDNITFDLSDDNCFEEDGLEICVDGTFTFSESGTFSLTIAFTSGGFASSDSEAGSYTLAGDMITLCANDGGECQEGTITFSGNELRLSVTDPDDSCSITFVLEKA